MSDQEMEAAMRELRWMVLKLHKAIRQHLYPLLKGREPEIQSAAIADLAATYIAGLAPQHRAEFRDMFERLVDELIPESEREMFGDKGHPGRACPD